MRRHAEEISYADILTPLIASRWVVPVPTVLLEHQSDLNLTDGELVYLLNVLAMKRRGSPYAAVKTLADRMGIDKRNARGRKESLSKKGFIVCRERREETVRVADEHDLWPLFEALERLMLVDLARKAQSEERVVPPATYWCGPVLPVSQPVHGEDVQRRVRRKLDVRKRRTHDEAAGRVDAQSIPGGEGDIAPTPEGDIAPEVGMTSPSDRDTLEEIPVVETPAGDAGVLPASSNSLIDNSTGSGAYAREENDRERGARAVAGPEMMDSVDVPEPELPPRLTPPRRFERVTCVSCGRLIDSERYETQHAQRCDYEYVTPTSLRKAGHAIEGRAA